MRGDAGRVRLLGRLRGLVGQTSGACAAPSASMYLDQRGNVRACCQNAGFTLGNVTQQSLREIWHGERARRLRAAVTDGDLSLGCSFCDWQTLEGNDELVFARTFDHLRPGPVDAEWPQQLELSLSNACNLQCVMCNGEWSSSIRAHRERLPPLPVVYDEAFFEGLAEFLPHLEVVKFLGGEPFLGGESLRVLEMLAEIGTDPTVHITTNGTQWSPRIERILDRLDVHVAVSIDGVTPETYESIRVGSHLDSVVENIDRFGAYARSRSTSLSLSHCLMTLNWHEFDQFLDFAEERDVSVYVNTVTEPYSSSLYHLRPQELRHVVETLEGRDRQVRSRLTGRRLSVWDEQLARLERHLASLELHEPPEYIAKRREQGFAWLAPPSRAAGAVAELDALADAGSGWMLELDAAGAIISADRRECSPQLDAWVDGVISSGDRSGVLAGRRSGPSTDDPGDLERYRVDLDPGAELELEVVRAARRDDDGVLAGVRVLLTDVADAAPGSPSVGSPPVASSSDEPAAGGPDALMLARAMASLPDDVDGFLIGPDQRLQRFLVADRGMFGLELVELLGRPVEELSDALAPVLGSPRGPVTQLRGDGPVEHHLTSLETTDGTRVELHSFAERAGDTTRVWVVRCAADA